MNSKIPAPTKEDRLAKALRDNLARRKALVRTKKERASADGDAAKPSTGDTARDDASS